MFNSLQLLKMGSILLGLPLVIALFAAVPAKAELVRMDEAPWLSSIYRVWEYTPGGGYNNISNPGQPGPSGKPWGGDPIYATLRSQSFTLNGKHDTWEALTGNGGFNEGRGLALAFESTGNSNFFYGAEMSVVATLNGFTMTFDLNNNGSFFHGFGAIQTAIEAEYDFQFTEGDWSLDFQFKTTADAAYKVYLLRGWEDGDGDPFAGGDVPEPATLAVLGLGLAGLGLARRRMKK